MFSAVCLTALLLTAHGMKPRLLKTAFLVAVSAPSLSFPPASAGPSVELPHTPCEPLPGRLLEQSALPPPAVGPSTESGPHFCVPGVPVRAFVNAHMAVQCVSIVSSPHWAVSSCLPSTG